MMHTCVHHDVCKSIDTCRLITLVPHPWFACLLLNPYPPNLPPLTSFLTSPHSSPFLLHPVPPRSSPVTYNTHVTTDNLCGSGRGLFYIFVACMVSCNSSYKHAKSSGWSDSAIQGTQWVTTLCPVLLFFISLIWLVLGCLGVGDLWHQNNKRNNRI